MSDPARPGTPADLIEALSPPLRAAGPLTFGGAMPSTIRRQTQRRRAHRRRLVPDGLADTVAEHPAAGGDELTWLDPQALPWVDPRPEPVQE
ncbi:hypothetical protein [Jatrophihabitans endophyticus]|uniref:hypothetical protein n=1 Tax=Jatrophihabitans endophyticus TaxID=1206085 RepID=UPI0019DA23A4|nr:hypothetical protein [Jatrophihabitans endophyticus]MBE7187179.1 hypothetical protein [Jatrophihabitans endophyticus]